MKTKDLVIEDYLYYPDVDAFLVHGFRPGSGQNLPRSVVGWMQRTAPENLISARSFADKPAVLKAYQAIIHAGEFPDEILSAADEQQQRVYDWEDQIIGTDSDRPVNDIKTAQKILRTISHDLKIDCPKLIWLEHLGSSDYDWDGNTIRFGNRSLMPLLHETAHAMQSQKSSDDGNSFHHSPGFVWNAITLYNRYLDIELDYLVQSATLAGLLGPLKTESPQHYILITKQKPQPMTPVPI